MLDVNDIQRASLERAKRWHNGDIHSWSVLEWAGAMAGEAGECVNFAKKMKRISEGILHIDSREGLMSNVDYSKLNAKAVKEAADTIMYGFCVFNVLGVDAEEVLREVFNTKSEEYGFPERI